MTAALRQMGLHEATTFSLYHHVLSRARWSALERSRRLLHLLVRTFVAEGGELTIVSDETLVGTALGPPHHPARPLARSTGIQ